jgi:hypothetical protein
VEIVRSQFQSLSGMRHFRRPSLLGSSATSSRVPSVPSATTMIS